MKIEKVNENQIRCTLTKRDLADRELKLSELAYGTEKAKNLFRDMMQQASFEFGFEAEDIPLMIEAIPLNSDCIILIITKVEDPEELDTRFSKFTPSEQDADENEFEDALNDIVEETNDILDLFKRIRGEKEESPDSQKAISPSKSPKLVNSAGAKMEVKDATDLSKIFVFDSLASVMKSAHALKNSYDSDNSLFKNTKSGKYKLLISKGTHSLADFNKVCNILSEYGTSEKYVLASKAYMEEHYDIILGKTAIQSLSGI